MVLPVGDVIIITGKATSAFAVFVFFSVLFSFTDTNKVRVSCPKANDCLSVSLKTIGSQFCLFLLTLLLWLSSSALFTPSSKECASTLLLKERMPRSMSRKAVANFPSSLVKIKTLAAYFKYVKDRHKAMALSDFISALVKMIETMM